MEKLNRQSSDFEELWSKYYSNRNSKNGVFYRNQLIIVYLPFLENVCKSVHFKLPSFVDLEDIKSYGVFGLIKSIKDYNRTKGSFKAYARPNIIGAIKDELRELDFVPRLIRLRAKQLEKATNKLELKLNRKPKDEELIEELSNDELYPSIPDNPSRFSKLKGEKKAKIILRNTRNHKKLCYGFNEIEDIEKISDRENKKINYLKDNNFTDPCIKIQKKDFKRFLEENLTEKQREILHLRYFLYYWKKGDEELGMSITDLGNVFGTSPQNMWKKCRHILKKLNTKLTEKGLTLEDCLERL